MMVKRFLLTTAIFLGGVLCAFTRNWTQTAAPTTNWYSIACSADGTKLAAVVNISPDQFTSLGCSLFVSTNSGATWFPSDATFRNCCSVAASADGAKIIVSSVYGPLYVSEDSGVLWFVTGPNNGNFIEDNYWGDVASSADGGKLVAAGYFGDTSIYMSTNSGITWTATSASTTSDGWSAISCSADGSRLAAAADIDTIYFSTNSGSDWAASTAPIAVWQSMASSADGRKLVAAASLTGYAAYPGSVYVSEDFGMTWSVTSAPSNSWISVASSADGNTLVAAVDGGLIYSSTNSGMTWNAADAPATNWQFVACSADGSKSFAGVNGGGIWTSQMIPSPALNLVATNGLQLSWTVPSMNFLLQQSPDLMNWSSLTNMPALNLTNLQNQIALPASGGSAFFRLKTP